ncbi:MAG: flagellar hook-associated protein FlgK [Sulfitobacter sp.]
MTISGALSNAMSGLRAAGRGAELVSSNISNALTPGYGRRVLSLSSSNIGTYGGVQVNGVTRVVDAGLASDRRLADAAHSHASLSTDFFTRIEKLLGTPDDPASLSAQLSGFENSLIVAASRPDAPERLNSAVVSARGLARSIGDASAGIQDARTKADQNIGGQVAELNGALQQIQALNSQITAAQVQNGNVPALLDQRQQVVDQIGALVPVREVPRDNGQIALYTTGGAILIDGSAATVGFEPVNIVTPYMTQSSGTLGGLTLNGVAIRTGSTDGALRGGAIGAQFAIRDEHAVEAQTQLDALARDLVERFQDPSVDGTLSVGDAGLFTDDGNAFDPLDEVGLSERLRLNASVDPDQGGQTWRIRDGMNATAPGNVGDASLLHSLTDTLIGARTPASGSFGGGAFSAINLVSTYISAIGGERTQSEQTLSYTSAQLTELTERQLADGVDSDDEIARLMVIEQAYAANARVIEAVDEMMQTMLRL